MKLFPFRKIIITMWYSWALCFLFTEPTFPTRHHAGFGSQHRWRSKGRVLLRCGRTQIFHLQKVWVFCEKRISTRLCLTFPFQGKFLFDLQTNASRANFPQFLTLGRLKLWPSAHFKTFGIHFEVVRRWLLADAHTPSWCVSSSVCYQWNLVPMI
jgi:hypothetical protein